MKPSLVTASKYFLLIGFVLLFCQRARCDETLAQQAIQEYQSALATQDRDLRFEKFRQAEVLFRRLIRQNANPNPDLYVNIGNAALQSRRIGPAIAAYRNALQLAPGHRRARSNLLYTRGLLPNWVRYETREGILQSVFFWNNSVSQDMLAAMAAICFATAAGLLAISLRWNQPVARMLALLPALAWLILLVSVFVAQAQSSSREAVVMPDEVIARSADSGTSAARFESPLPGGTEVIILEQRDDWTQVQLSNNQSAWVPSSSLRAVP